MQRLILLFVLMLALPGAAFGETKTLSAQHLYIIGEGETRADARRLCAMEAKRKVVEQAGVVVETQTEVRELVLSRDEIRTFASAFVQVQDVKEEFLLQGEAFAVRCELTAKVDTRAIGTRLREFAQDAGRRQNLSHLSGQMTRLQDEALGEDQSSTGIEQRREALGSLEEMEAQRDVLVRRNKRLNVAAREVVAYGMTMEDVTSMLGSPSVKKVNTATSSTYACHRYGQTWVVYKDGLAQCLRARLSFQNRYGGDCHCAGFSGEVQVLR